jgi:CubicO group peptidase (beta-lactamase class C family)
MPLRARCGRLQFTRKSAAIVRHKPVQEESIMRIGRGLGLIGLIVAGVFAASAEESPVISIWHSPPFQPDGRLDWNDAPGTIELLVDKNGRVQPPEDFDPQVQWAWTDEGLCLALRVRDDIRHASPDTAAPQEGDSVEVFVARGRGAKEMYHAVILPPTSSEPAPLEVRFHGPRMGSPTRPLDAKVVGAAGVKGDYVLEALFPWSNLDIEAKEGEEIGLQIFVNDLDAPVGRFQAIWYPRTRTHEDTTAMYRVRLGGDADGRDDVSTNVRAEYDDLGQMRVALWATDALAGKEASVRRGDAVVASAPLRPRAGRAARTFHVPMPAPGSAHAPVTVWVDGQQVAAPDLPDPEDARAKLLMTQEFVFTPYVFKGTQFPTCDFANPLAAANLLGPYSIEVRYFDKDYNEVDRAAETGRYGAVLDIIPDNGAPLRRFRTLFRAPDSFDAFRWSFAASDASVDLPEVFGVKSEAVAYQSDSVGRYVHRLFEDALNSDAGAAMLLAGIHETAPHGERATTADNARALDRQWWVGLKRKLYGTDTAFPAGFECPRPIEGEPAPTVREGTAAEAGMNPETVDKLDALCREWAEASGEPFGVCLVRHGVAFFHRAYGDYHGRPMTTDTKTWMASISKLLGGIQMALLADRGLVDFDDPAGKYLPPLREVNVAKPLTIRHLYTHTNGLLLGIQPKGYYPDHWGDEFNDLEHIVAEYYPRLKVGEKLGYNGVGYAVAGKIIEQVTGEAQPVFARRHFLDPLGCDHTDIIDMSAYTRSIPMDMARIGQMLLNKGAYGNLRFFSPETFEKILPQRLTGILGPDTDVEWGIGAVRMPLPGLGPNTFGHGAASAATFVVDPDNDMVIVMTRDSGGPRYNDYHPKFIATVAEGIAK